MSLKSSLNELQVVITAEISDFEKKLASVQKNLKDFQGHLESVFQQKNVLDVGADEIESQLNGAKQAIDFAKDSMKRLETEIANSTKEVSLLKKEFEDLQAGIGIHPSMPDYMELMESYPKWIAEAEKQQRFLNSHLQVQKALLHDSEDRYTKLVKRQQQLRKETEKATKSTKTLGKELNGIVGVFKRMIIRRTLMAVVSKMKEMLDLLARFDKEMNGKLKIDKQFSDISAAFYKMVANITVVAAELVAAFAPVITFIMNAISKIAEFFSATFAMLRGKTEYTVANPDYWRDYAEQVEASAKAQKHLISGFDELNVYSSNKSNQNEIKPGDMFITKELSGAAKSVAEFMNNIGDLGQLAAFAGALGAVGLATKLLTGLFNRKNKSLGEQNGLESDAAHGLQYALVPALGLAAAGVAALAGKLKDLPQKLPELKPQLDLNPAYNALENFGKQVGQFRLPTLVPTLSNALIISGLKAISELFKGYELPKLSPQFNLQPAIDFGQRVIEKISNIKIPQLKPTIDISKVSQGINTMGNEIQSWVNQTKNQVQNWSTNVINTINSGISTSRSNIQGWVNETRLSVSNIVNSLSTGLNNCRSNIQTFTSTLVSSMTSALNNTKQNIITWSTTTLTNVRSWATNTSQNIKSATTSWAQNAYQALSSFATNTNNFLTNTSSNISRWCSNTAGNIKSWASNVASNVGSALSSAWQNFKNFMSATGEKISGAWTKVSPVVVPLAITAGITALGVALAPYTGGASLGLAAFANGGVVNRPTLAMVGEGKNSFSNPEIITPESKMKEVLEANNSELLSGFAQMTRQIIAAIEDVDMNVSIGDDVIAKSAKRGANTYQKMTGAPLLG